MGIALMPQAVSNGDRGAAFDSLLDAVRAQRDQFSRDQQISAEVVDLIRKAGFYRATVRYGFMEIPDVPAALATAGSLHFEPLDTTYFASRESIVSSPHRGMAVWRERLFRIMHRNAAPATDFFRIPPTRLVELGAPIEI